MSYSIQIPSLLPAPENKKNVEVELIEQEKEIKNETSPPIRFSEAPKELIDDSLDALRKKADLLSEKVQRVKKEMRAKLFGLTKNRLMELSKAKFHEQRESNQNQKTQVAKNDHGDLGLRFEKKESEPNPLDLTPSTFGNNLNNKIEVGNFTALNTDRHLFYSFYARIEEVIRPPWEDSIVALSQRINVTSPLKPKGGWSTRIDVLLNPEGRLIKVILLKSSGIDGFDQAPIQAFQRAGFFPHPPKEIVNEDGVIVLKYVFTVF